MGEDEQMSEGEQEREVKHVFFTFHLVPKSAQTIKDETCARVPCPCHTYKALTSPGLTCRLVRLA